MSRKAERSRFWAGEVVDSATLGVKAGWQGVLAIVRTLNFTKPVKKNSNSEVGAVRTGSKGAILKG